MPLEKIASLCVAATDSPWRGRGVPTIMQKLVINDSLAGDIMVALQMDGVSALTMLPGYAGVARHVREGLHFGTLTRCWRV